METTEEVIDVKNPKGIDWLRCVRLCAETINGDLLIESVTQRENAELAIDEIHTMIEFMARGPRSAEKEQAVKEGQALVVRLVEKIDDYNATAEFVSCPDCLSSFIGQGPYSANALAEAHAGLAAHTCKKAVQS